MNSRKLFFALAAAWGLAGLIVLLFRLGAPGSVCLFSLAVPGLFVWYFLQTRQTGRFLLLCGNLALAWTGGKLLSTRLYFLRVSDDWATPVVGLLVTCAGLTLILLTTLILAILKAVRSRKARLAAPEPRD